MYNLIRKKRDRNELSREKIRGIVANYAAGEIPDYQMNALLMAIYFRGLTRRETADLTEVLIDTADSVDLSGLRGAPVDKHSQG